MNPIRPAELPSSLPSSEYKAGRALENAESEFVTRYAAYAAQGLLYPQREGSPLMEFASGGRVLYLFDRTGPYTANPGPAQVIVHGVVQVVRLVAAGADAPHTEQVPTEQLQVEGISGVRGVGRVLEAGRRMWVVQARLPLVLGSFEALPEVAPGDWVEFATVPPLHGFLVSQ